LNLSNDPQQEYFADGMTEALIADLSKIRALGRVISRTSIMSYKGTRTPLPDIGRQLHVDALVEGSVARSGDRVRVRVQLIHAATERHLWTETYERELRDVLLLQSDVARAIAQEIGIKLTSNEQAQLMRARPVHPEAHQAYLLGRYFWNRRTAENMRRAIVYFQQAVDKDPDYALAYAGLADGYNRLSLQWGSPKGFLKAREAATKALALDDMLAEAHAALAFVKHRFDWDWISAEREFKRAIELNPGYANAYDWYAFYLLNVGRGNEALAVRKQAQALDPLSLEIGSNLGYTFFYLRQYDQAIEELRKVIDLDGNYWHPRFLLGAVYTAKGMYEEAIAELKKARQLEDNPIILGWLGVAYARSGQRDAARKALDELRGLSKERYVRPYDVALIYTALGDKDQAIEWLEKGYEDRATSLFLKGSPGLDDLRSDPRFAELERRYGLPP